MWNSYTNLSEIAALKNDYETLDLHRLKNQGGHWTTKLYSKRKNQLQKVPYLVSANLRTILRQPMSLLVNFEI